MKKNEWISVKESLPGLGKTIEIKTENHELIKARCCLDVCDISIVFEKQDNRKHRIPLSEITHYRYCPDKIPDLHKLKFRDLVVVEISPHETIGIESFCGYILNLSIDRISISETDGACHNITNIKTSYIKKITRINIKDKTFEEI